MNKVTTQERSDDSGDRIIDVFVNGKLVLSWDDWQAAQCPQDLIWSREISEVFSSALSIADAQFNFFIGYISKTEKWKDKTLQECEDYFRDCLTNPNQP